jgi:hypothetical protein
MKFCIHCVWLQKKVKSLYPTKHTRQAQTGREEKCQIYGQLKCKKVVFIRACGAFSFNSCIRGDLKQTYICP